MAQKRMFSRDVVTRRGFLEMPPSSRALYYQLGMEADDDGFVDPYLTMLAVKATEDDLKVLMAKGFVIKFESGVVVIRHWNINNTLKNDRYKETLYINEKSRLLESKGEYLLSDSNGSTLEPQLNVTKRNLTELNVTEQRLLNNDESHDSNPSDSSFKEFSQETQELLKSINAKLRASRGGDFDGKS